MELCQRDTNGNLIAETAQNLPVCLVIDSSGDMGSYFPDDIEAAINAFFRTVAVVEEANALIHICIIESHDEVRALGAFGHASSFDFGELRSGGNWSLPDAVAQAAKSSMEYARVLEQYNVAHKSPLVVVVSDNPVSDDCSLYQPVDAIVSGKRSEGIDVPRCLFVSSSADNHFKHHVPDIEFCQASRRELQSRLVDIAEEIIRIVRPLAFSRYAERRRQRRVMG